LGRGRERRQRDRVNASDGVDVNWIRDGARDAVAKVPQIRGDCLRRRRLVRERDRQGHGPGDRRGGKRSDRRNGCHRDVARSGDNVLLCTGKCRQRDGVISRRAVGVYRVRDGRGIPIP